MNNNIKEIMSILKSSENKVKIKLLGDSITHGVGGIGFQQSGSPIVKGYARNPDGHCWANTLKNYLESNYNCELTNNACTGTRIEFIIENLNELIRRRYRYHNDRNE